MIKEKQGLFLSACEDFDEAIKLEQNNPVYFNNRGCLRMRLKKYILTVNPSLNGALQDLEQALKLNPKDPVVYSNLG